MAGKAQQGTRGRGTGSRGQERRAEARREQWLLIGVGAVVAIAAVIILVGLYFTQYRPPRSHVLTVDGTDYNAADIVRRATYMLRFEASAAQITAENLVQEALKQIERDHILRERAPATVGEVSREELEQDLRAQLGFATPTPSPAASATPGPAATASPTSTATATATPLATPTAFPTPTARPFDAAGYATALRDLLRNADMGRREYERLAEARLLSRRLRDRYQAEIGTVGAQLRLARIRLTDEVAAERVREQAAAGGDFVRLASENSLDGATRRSGGELGWQAVDLLEPQVRDTLKGLTGGSVAIARSGNFIDVYKVLEGNDRRQFDAGQLAQLVDRRMDAWFDAERSHVEAKRDLSEGEEDWIREQTGKRLQDALS